MGIYPARAKNGHGLMTRLSGTQESGLASAIIYKRRVFEGSPRRQPDSPRASFGTLLYRQGARRLPTYGYEGVCPDSDYVAKRAKAVVLVFCDA